MKQKRKKANKVYVIKPVIQLELSSAEEPLETLWNTPEELTSQPRRLRYLFKAQGSFQGPRH